MSWTYCLLSSIPGPVAHPCRYGKLTYTVIPPKHFIPRLNRLGEEVMDKDGEIIMIPNEMY